MTISANRVTTPGLDIHYLQAGTGEPVVLLHGFPQTSHQWRHQITALSAAGYACFAPDNRGFGRTDKPRTRISRGLLARDVARFMDAVGIESAHLVTHDWGGIIGFKVVADHPDRVRSIALVDTLCTVWPTRAIHGYWFKVEGLAEDFFANHHRAMIEVFFGGRDGDDLPAPPIGAFPAPSGTRPRPAWIEADDLDHYRDAFADPESHFAAIQYYRYGLPFHVVTTSEDGTEQYQSLSETQVAEMWQHPGGLRDHPLYAEPMDYGPEDRRTCFERPALLLLSQYLSARGATHGDPTIPTGSAFLDQFGRYFPNLTARACAGGHFLGEELAGYVNEQVLAHLGAARA